jgi:hypothetical protein
MRHGTSRVQPKTGIAYVVGEWCPELVGKVAGYPATAEAYERHRAQLNANRESAKASGRLTRTGVPNGWSGRKTEVIALRRNAQTDAERIMERLADERVFVPDCREARIAMTALVATILDPTMPPRHKIEAARAVLTYTSPRPTPGGRIPTDLAEKVLLRIDALKEEARAHSAISRSAD